MTDNRRLAAIMFTDIVGYSGLMSQDEERALEISRQNRDIQKALVSEHNGDWVKDLGDGALAMFVTAWDSVQCALAIQASVREKGDYQVRVGIHLGDITIENDDAFGDGVNVASRLESKADPGGIYISESVYKAIRSRENIPVKDLGELQLKNISYPIRVYALAGEGLPQPSAVQVPQKEPRGKFGIKQVTTYAVVIILVMILGQWGMSVIFPDASSDQQQSIAVIPLANLSGDTQHEFLVDGLHDAIIGKLGQVPGLRVISRTSTLRFKDTKMSIPEIAKELQVDNIIEASVMGSDESFRVQVQLIQAFPQETHVWSGEFERSLNDFFNLQDDVAYQVATALDVETTALSQEHQSINPEVYKQHLRGMHFLSKGGKENFLSGIDALIEAVEIDPASAFAYSSLAQGYAILGHSYISTAEHFVKAKAAANKALELDPSSAEAWGVLADVLMYNDWEYPAAEKAFKKAISLKPNLAEAHAHYAWLHKIYLRDDQAIQEAHLSVEIDPFSTIYTGWLAWLYLGNDSDQAIHWAKKTLKLNPN